MFKPCSLTAVAHFTHNSKQIKSSVDYIHEASLPTYWPSDIHVIMLTLSIIIQPL